jgi:hypothetical protein
VRFVLALLLVVMLTACGHGTMIAAGDPRVSSCTVHTADAGLAVTFHVQGADAACNRLIQDAAKKGAYWTTRPAETDALPVVCNLARDQVVVDVAAALLERSQGERICAAFVADGYSDL